MKVERYELYLRLRQLAVSQASSLYSGKLAQACRNVEEDSGRRCDVRVC